MKATLSTVSNDGRPWSAIIKMELKDGLLIIKLKKKYQHYRNLSSNPECVLVFESISELIVRARKLKEADQDDGLSEIYLKPYWLRVSGPGTTTDYSSFENINETINSLFSS